MINLHSCTTRISHVSVVRKFVDCAHLHVAQTAGCANRTSELLARVRQVRTAAEVKPQDGSRPTRALSLSRAHVLNMESDFDKRSAELPPLPRLVGRPRGASLLQPTLSPSAIHVNASTTNTAASLPVSGASASGVGCAE